MQTKANEFNYISNEEKYIYIPKSRGKKQPFEYSSCTLYYILKSTFDYLQAKWVKKKLQVNFKLWVSFVVMWV